MRERKYRAWDRVNKHMYYVDFDDLLMSVGSQGAGDWTLVEQVGDEIAGFVTGKDGRQRGDIEYMDWIGKKDKNGKDIYESDVVDSDYAFSAKRSIIQWGDTSNEWGICGYGFILPDQAKDIEVIGNIWEHPHLNEAQQ